MLQPSSAFVLEKLPHNVLKLSFCRPHLTDEADISAIKETVINQILNSDQPKVVVSFANVSHMSSAMLSCLLGIRSKTQTKHGQLRLAGIRPNLLEVFKMTNLTTIFEIFENEADAMRSFSGH